jgi:propionyl-CoA carboxylase beta chain
LPDDLVGAGAKVHTSKSGVAHGAFDNDISLLARTRELVDFLPLSNRHPLPQRVTDDPAYVDRRDFIIEKHCCIVNGWMECRDRLVPALDFFVPKEPNTPYNMSFVIHSVVDDGHFFEIMPDHARSALTSRRSRINLFCVSVLL